ncbi:MAG: hypothetical protein ACJASB_000727 [Shewanella psychromarinicola]|jgi:hypothetical protein
MQITKKTIALAREATQCLPYTFLNKPIVVNSGNEHGFGQFFTHHYR